ncbi:MAG: aminotransferase class I/II-fold pyridoxal phosphate-dependent enzyme [candidate division NC10 bacterium]|nr:aminotransferase class I/II-fold pyridoxal phosphate-dependent enzyme [candidate division NC10 bacterium]
MISDRQFRTPLFDALVSLAESRKVSFHTPGHKSGKGISTRFKKFVGPKIFSIDLTTLDEVDCLQKPTGVIKEAQELAAEAYGADHSFFLINGSTVGNHAMVLAACSPQDEVLVARNTHKSILTGIILAGARPHFFLPAWDPDLGIPLNVTPEAVNSALENHPQAKALILTSPNYYGVTADLEAIFKATRQRGLLLLVDEAHGPHLNFHPDLPPPALRMGADLCVQSTHKIVGGMTQSSMMHLKGNRIDLARLQGALQLMQSTSPSYVLMASLDLARMQMATEGRKLLEKAIHLAEEARDQIRGMGGMSCFGRSEIRARGSFDLDVTKLTISTRGLDLTGFQASALLNGESDVQVEMADLSNVLVIVSIGDRKDDLSRLIRGLERIAQSHPPGRGRSLEVTFPPLGASLHLSPREAYFAPYRYVSLKEAAGEISSDVITIYPPGIPLLVPGEPISREIVDYLAIMGSKGARVDGLKEGSTPQIRVVAG